MYNCDCGPEGFPGKIGQNGSTSMDEPSGVPRLRVEPRPPQTRRIEQGFTLLELLVVMAIIALLGALIGPRLFERLEDSKVVTAQTQVRMLKTALDTMRLDIGRYPTTEEGLDLLVRAPVDPKLRLRWHGPYLEGEVPLDPWSNPYQYNPSGRDLNAITLYSYGPTGRPGGEMVGFLPAS
jgi:general secretion pathway protein G